MTHTKKIDNIGISKYQAPQLITEKHSRDKVNYRGKLTSRKEKQLWLSKKYKVCYNAIMKECVFKNGKSTLIDNETVEKLERYGLRLVLKGEYVEVCGKLQNFIMENTPSSDSVVDHINGNTLDNRKSNLRITNHSGNMKNRELKLFKDAKYYCLDKARQKWLVYFPRTFQRYGEYNTEVEARDAVERMLSGHEPEKKLANPSKGLPKYINKVKTFGSTYYQVRPIIGGKREYVGSYRSLEEAEQSLKNFMQRRI